MGGIPALFKSFTSQAGFDYDVSLETVAGANLDFRYEAKLSLLARAWDHVVLQAYSTLDRTHPEMRPRSSLLGPARGPVLLLESAR
jgi:hypothetical protein